MHAVPVQLPLGVRLRPDAQFNNFLVGPNALILDSLQALFDSDDCEPIIYISGASGSGRSHLLQACCHQAEISDKEAIYLPAAELQPLAPAVFESLEYYDLICLDDLERLLGKPEWEEALFHLYNRVRDAGKQLVIAADEAPAFVGAELADLRSRLGWGLVFQIKPLSDQQKLEVLSLSANARGLSVTDEVMRFMLNHGERNLSVLMDQLDQLDQASLSAKRKLTIPFVKQVLNWS